MSLQDVKDNEKNLIGSFPNTYTFTKNLAEKYIKKNQDNVKCVIVRPSIIASSLNQPFKGWTDSISAAGGLTVLGTLGILKYMHIPKPNPFDIVPVDIVSNSILVVTAFHGGIGKTETAALSIYNTTTTSQNPITMEGYKDIGIKSLKYV